MATNSSPDDPNKEQFQTEDTQPATSPAEAQRSQQVPPVNIPETASPDKEWKKPYPIGCVFLFVFGWSIVFVFYIRAIFSAVVDVDPNLDSVIDRIGFIIMFILLFPFLPFLAAFVLAIVALLIQWKCRFSKATVGHFILWSSLSLISGIFLAYTCFPENDEFLDEFLVIDCTISVFLMYYAITTAIRVHRRERQSP